MSEDEPVPSNPARLVPVEFEEDECNVTINVSLIEISDAYSSNHGKSPIELGRGEAKGLKSSTLLCQKWPENKEYYVILVDFSNSPVIEIKKIPKGAKGGGSENLLYKIYPDLDPEKLVVVFDDLLHNGEGVGY